MNKLGDIWYNEPQETIWDKIKMIGLALIVVAAMYSCSLVMMAQEEHQLCLNGAVEHCIPEDFE